MGLENTHLSEAQIAVLNEVKAKFGFAREDDESAIQREAILTPADVTKIFKPTSAQAYSADLESLRGWCMEQIHKNDLAMYIYDEILEKCPLHAVTLRRKAQLLVKMGRQEESNDLFDVAVLL
jgi:hypothetical protein